MTLTKIIQRLHASNIGCGLQTQLGGQIEVWIGDDFKGLTIHHFSAHTADDIPDWLEATALERYPDLDLTEPDVGAPALHA